MKKPASTGQAAERVYKSGMKPRLVFVSVSCQTTCGDITNQIPSCLDNSDNRLEPMPIGTDPTLLLELIRYRSVNAPELPADRAHSVPRHLIPQVIGSLLHIPWQIQWFHFRFLTNGSAFLPEMTPLAGKFAAFRRAFSASNSATERPTNDI